MQSDAPDHRPDRTPEQAATLKRAHEQAEREIKLNEGRERGAGYSELHESGLGRVNDSGRYGRVTGAW